MNLSFDFIGGGLGTCGALVTSIITNLTGGLGNSSLHLTSPKAHLGYLQ